MKEEKIQWCRVKLQWVYNQLDFYLSEKIDNAQIKKQLDFEIKFWKNEITKLQKQNERNN